MLALLRIANIVLLLALVGCFAGALAGLIVLVPFVGGAWLLNLIALTAYEEHVRPGWIERIHAPLPDTKELSPAVPTTARAATDRGRRSIEDADPDRRLAERRAA
jgi:hypothetical protein